MGRVPNAVGADAYSPQTPDLSLIAKTSDLANLDVPVSSRPSGTNYSAARAAFLDRLDALISSRPSGTDYTTARAILLANLDALISSRPSATDYTAARAARIDAPASQTRHYRFNNAGGGSFVTTIVTADSNLVNPNFSPWVQINGGLGGGEVYIHAIEIFEQRAASGQTIFEIGIGAAGSEVPLSAFSFIPDPIDPFTSNPIRKPLWIPLSFPLLIPPNTRFALRTRNTLERSQLSIVLMLVNAGDLVPITT